MDATPDDNEEDQLDSTPTPSPSKSKRTKHNPTRAAKSASSCSIFPPNPKKPRRTSASVPTLKIKIKPVPVRPATRSQSAVKNVASLSSAPGPEATAPVPSSLPAVGAHAKPGPQDPRSLSLDDLPVLPSSALFQVFTPYFLHFLFIMQLVFLCSNHSVVCRVITCRTRKDPLPVSLRSGVNPARTVL